MHLGALQSAISKQSLKVTSCIAKMFSKVRVQAVSFSVARTVRSFSQFKKVGVVGLGLMGHGVAQVTAAAGYQVLAIEAKPEALAVGMKRFVCISWRFVTRLCVI